MASSGPRIELYARFPQIYICAPSTTTSESGGGREISEGGRKKIGIYINRKSFRLKMFSRIEAEENAAIYRLDSKYLIFMGWWMVGCGLLLRDSFLGFSRAIAVMARVNPHLLLLLSSNEGTASNYNPYLTY
jgi:hypothetical protein